MALPMRTVCLATGFPGSQPRNMLAGALAMYMLGVAGSRFIKRHAQLLAMECLLLVLVLRFCLLVDIFCSFSVYILDRAICL